MTLGFASPGMSIPNTGPTSASAATGGQRGYGERVPKRVDHDERRRQIADSLVRTAATRGLHATGMREVAAEASPRDVIAAILTEGLPVDDERRTFTILHTAYLAVSLTDPPGTQPP
jgi:hypothetical protein